MSTSSRLILYSPRYWAIWLGLGILWTIAKLASYRVSLAMGRRIGRIGYRLATRRRHITEVNVSLCFPDLSDSEQKTIVKEHFEAVGISLLMMGFSWWASDAKFGRLVQARGLENLERLLKEGNGVLMIGMHFVDLDIIGRMLGQHYPFTVVYRQHENPVIELLFQHNRKRRFSQAIPKDDIRSVLRALKNNQIVWLSPDQARKGKNTLLAPFFGIPASTTTIISRIARVSGAPVLLGYGYRLPDAQGYMFEAQPQLEDFPGESVEHDTNRVNLLIEGAVHKAPAQYLWSHRRFKKRPGLADPY